MKATRRTFLWNVGALGAAGLVGWPESARGYFANDAIQVGLIGFGGRCRHLYRELSQMPGCRVTAVCDVYRPNLEAAKEQAGPDAFATGVHEELLDRKDVDAVIIATPDHWHVPITVDACRAGKDVYVEKPLTHDLSEGARVIEAEASTNRIIQVGMQQRSMTHLIEAKKIVESGALGTVRKVRLSWNRNVPRHVANFHGKESDVDWKRFLGNAPEQPFDGYKMTQWRWFWDFGGGLLTDLMVHWMDVVNWYLDLDVPSTATTIGDHFLEGAKWETPDTVQTLVRYTRPATQVHFEGTFVNRRDRAMTEFMGSEATLYIDRGRYELHPEKPNSEPTVRILGTGDRGLDFYDEPNGEQLHLANWLESIRSREKPRCSAEIGVKAVLASHLANRAYRTNQVAAWTS